MKLTRLRLIGFKSFVEPTDFEIEPGLTGVVGPNGCGKSNLVEAVRWVMGETSYKAMRAADMDDVIFSGNDRPPGAQSRRGRGFHRQCRPHAPRPPSTMPTRSKCRAASMREHGSTFRVNGREVRARDVSDAVCRCLHRLAFARSGASGPDRRDHPGASPSSAAACSKKPPALPACMRADTRPNCGSRPPSRIWPASKTCIGQLATQVDA